MGSFRFLQYIAAGLDVNLAIAIDFTQSNGDPQYPTSLHYMNMDIFNPYQQGSFCLVDFFLFLFSQTTPSSNLDSHPWGWNHSRSL